MTDFFRYDQRNLTFVMQTDIYDAIINCIGVLTLFLCFRKKKNCNSILLCAEYEFVELLNLCTMPVLSPVLQA